MATSSQTPTKAEKKRLLALGDAWSLSSKTGILSGDFYFDNHVDGLMLITRITVYSLVFKIYPELVLKHDAKHAAVSTHVKVTFHATAKKPLSTHEIDFAEKINRILSTATKSKHS